MTAIDPATVNALSVSANVRMASVQWSRLHMACWNRDVAAVRELLKVDGIDLNVKGAVGDVGGHTPLHVAAAAGSAEILSLLLSAGGFDATAGGGHIDDADADPSLPAACVPAATSASAKPLAPIDVNAQTFPLCPVVRTGRGGTVHGLMNMTAFGYTALHLAAHGGFTDAIRVLVNVGKANVNLEAHYYFSDGWTALHFVSHEHNMLRQRTPAGVDCLLSVPGIELNTLTRDAGEAYNAERMRLFGTPPPWERQYAPYGFSPLHNAAYYGDGYVVEALLRSGADLSVRSDLDRSVLHFATMCNHAEEAAEIVKALLVHGADANVTDADGETPLHTAFLGRDATTALVVAALLDAGADVTILDKKGNSALGQGITALTRREIESHLYIETLKAEGAIDVRSSVKTAFP